MSRVYAPLPSDDPIATGYAVPPEGERVPVSVNITFAWERWLSTLGIDVGTRAEKVSVVDLSSQGASIAATALPIGSITHGVYRVSYYARITTVAGVTSSLTVEFDWPDGGVTQTHTGAAMNGNLTTTHQQDIVTMDVDSSGPIRYNTTYASNAAGVMKYKLVIACEKVDV